MEIRQARLLLGFPPNSLPTPSQVKAAFRERVWDFHPDRLPDHAKAHAESKFKLGNDSPAVCMITRSQISEAYNSLLSGGGEGSSSAAYSPVVRTGVPVATEGRNWALMGVPFFFVIFGAVGLGGLSATRAYRRQKEAYPSSHNPFLPSLDQSDSNRNPGSLVGNWARRLDSAILVDVRGSKSWPNCGNQCSKYQQSSFLLY